MTRRLASCVLIPLLLVLSSCGSDDDSGGGATTTTSESSDLEGSLTVLAAASLTDAFGDIAEAFEEEHDGVNVELSFDGSANLATAIIEGAPADLFASADEANLQK